jgi:hypothetical protein
MQPTIQFLQRPNPALRSRCIVGCIFNSIGLIITHYYPREEERAAEASQSEIRDGYGEDGCGKKVVGTERLILTQHSPYL